MKKTLAIAIAMLAVMGTMASCGGNADNEAYKDGSYRAEAKDFDDHGWKEYINVTVKDTEKLEKSLVEKQDASKVDTVAGATNSTNSFKQMMKELEKNMKKGDTNTVTVAVASAE